MLLGGRYTCFFPEGKNLGRVLGREDRAKEGGELGWVVCHDIRRGEECNLFSRSL